MRPPASSAAARAPRAATQPPRRRRLQHGDAAGEVSSHVRLSPNPPRSRFKEKPRLPEWTGLELESVRPLKSPVSPSAATRSVAFGSAHLLDLCGGIVSERSREAQLPLAGC